MEEAALRALVSFVGAAGAVAALALDPGAVGPGDLGSGG
jgi:hypothetical protein